MQIKEVLGSAPLRAWKKEDAEHMDFPAASSGQSQWKLWAEDRAKPGKINGNYLWKKAWEGGKGRISLWTKEKPRRVLHGAGILGFHTKHPEQAEFPKIPGNELLFAGKGGRGVFV